MRHIAQFLHMQERNHKHTQKMLGCLKPSIGWPLLIALQFNLGYGVVLQKKIDNALKIAANHFCSLRTYSEASIYTGGHINVL